MTDTGQIPGEGLPGNAVGDAAHQPHTDLPGNGVPQQPGWGAEPQIPQPSPVPPGGPAQQADELGTPAYGFLDHPAAPGSGLEDEDDVLLMPGPQGSWSDPQPVPPQRYDTPSVLDPGVPLPLMETVDAMGQAAAEPIAAPAAPRRPLHLGPPIPDQPTGGVSVRSLADRGPAVRLPGAPGSGPEYFDASSDPAAGIPAQQTGEPSSPAGPVQGSAWPAAATGPVASQQSLIPHADSTVPSQIPAQLPPQHFAPAAPAAPQAPAAAPTPPAAPATEEPRFAPQGPQGQQGPAAGGALPEQVSGDTVGHSAAEQVPGAAAPLPVAAPAPASVPLPMPDPEPTAQAATVLPPAVPEQPAVAAEPPEAQQSLPEQALAGAVQSPPAASLPERAEDATPEVTAAALPPAPVEAQAAPEPPVVEVVEVSAVPGAPDDAATPAAGVPLPAEAVAPPAPDVAPVPAVFAAPQPTEPGSEAVGETASAPAPAAAPAPDVAVVPAAVVDSPPTPAAPQEAAVPGDAVVPDPADASASTAPVAEAITPDAPDQQPSPEAGPVSEAGKGRRRRAAPAEESVAADPDAAPPAPDEAPLEAETGPAAEAYEPAVRDAVHRVIRERRDIRNGFRSDPIPHDVLLRVLEAAHTAPSVGHSQPWDFVVIRSEKTREKMHELAMVQREAYAKSLPKARARQFRELKIEAILDTPVNIVVTADPTRGGRHTLGRHTQPQMAPYSSALAVENLWLAARAEGLGVGWVSFFDERQMVAELGLPEHLEVVAYLCVGYVDEFPDEPELTQAGWSERRPLSWVVHDEEYGNRALPGEEPHDLLEETLRGIRPLDAKALGEAWERQKRMTKPAGALGMLEIISAQLSGLSRQCPPPIPEPAAVAIFAGDHGVHAQGVTSWPQEVTAQMVANFLGGGAVCNAFANQVGAEICVIDVGVASELPTTPGLLPRKVRPGTADFTAGPAMSREEALRAIEIGIETARDLVSAGNKALLTGEMGIANTTASAALIAVYTGVDPAEVTGRGTGINDEMHARKIEVVRRGLELHRPDPADPINVLAAFGGLEHAALVGLLLGAAALRTPVILDGVSAGAAALVARAIAPEVLAACIAGHRSAEPGHVAALTTLGLRPLVDLDLRLGEGTGALLALPLVQSAARVMHEVATFDAAGVTEKG
ncbi:nicotinate-nucleotide--dimethylbenzimidazole phosphoribosyltransferase [Streptomyces polygonati]|uniref:Nicotinate-nucleotide--dimethylbenzimidazole phosphoribosyltransferase n=1 Tax=Streptomyces polygonati TaxID=1617087 RepID=A0ABV8HJC1_9ACTN